MYLVYGDDHYLLNQRTKQIVSELNVNGETEVDEYSYLDQPLVELLNVFNTLGMFSNRKIIVVRDCFFLTEEKIKLKYENNMDYLLKYLNNPNPDVELILVCPTSKISNRLKIVKKCKSFEHVYEMVPLTQAQIADAIKKRVKAKNGVIDDDGVFAIINGLPNDCDVLFNELEKLMHLEKPITRELVDANIIKYLDTDLFKLVDCLLNDDVAQFLNVYYYLKSQKLDYNAFVGLLASNLVTIRNIAILHQQRYSAEMMSQMLNIHPYRIKILYNHAKQKTITAIDSMLSVLYGLDKIVKQGAFDMNADVILDTFVLKLFNK